MPKITVPQDIEIEIGAPKPVPFSFVGDFLTRTLLRDKQFGVNTEQLFAAMEIRTAFKEAKPGCTVELTEDQWTKLAAVTRTPSDPYNPAVMIDAKSFLDAILKPEK